MSEEVSPVKKSTNNVTIIQVDKDISFVLDTRDVNFGVSLQDKNSSLSRKTYSKKHPVAYNPCVSYLEDSISAVGTTSSGRAKKPNSKLSGKCTDSCQTSTKGKAGRKRLADSDRGVSDSQVHKRGRKRGSVTETSPAKFNGRVTPEKQRSSRELRNDREDSPDSDIEIIEIVSPSTSRASSETSRKSVNGDFSRRKRQVTSVLKPSSYTTDDVPITEADTAPYIPPYSVLPDFNSNNESNSSFQSSFKWLSANGTLSISAIPNVNGGTNSNSDPLAKFNDKFHLYMPEIKIPQNDPVPQKKPGCGKRELKGLYKNLNEISWAHEKSFKKLLEATTDNRHSERITAKVIGGKNLRRLNTETLKKLTSNQQKPGPARKNTAKLALTRAKYSSLKPKLLVKTVQKRKVHFNKVNKINKSSIKSRKTNTKTPKLKVKVARKAQLKTKKGKVVKKPLIKSNNTSDKKVDVKNEKENVTKSVIKIKSNVVNEKKVYVKKEKENVTKPIIKPDVTKFVTHSVTKPVTGISAATQPVVKPIKSILKSPKSMLKVRFKDVEAKNGPKGKAVSVNKQKLSSVIDIASSSKNCNILSDSFQNSTGNCSYSTDNSGGLFSAFEKNIFRTDNFSDFNNSALIQELRKYDASNEVQLIKHTNSDKVLETAMKKGSKLRVSVEPLEHTKLWNSDFFESFKRHVLEQALLQTFERRDQESINNMFQELQDACFRPPNNIKSLKKKKSSDEEVLRSSVRQIGRGYGYKEIFVKKMENYLQFVLLPHACKLNSLNIEAIKELKEAFIQAKKDPTCRAVLLNSSGTYFCTGIELSLLVGSNRKQAAEEMASSIRDLVLTLSTFTKPIIAAVNGTAVGLGVALLTYCDVVLASDKATFCIPATRLGYLPEGGVTLTLPQVVGSGVATEMLLYGRRLTAEQALRHGLISEVLWPTQLMNEVVPRMETICSQPLQVMEATKTMVRCHLWDKLKTHIEREWRLLPPLWLEAQCQHNIKRTLATGWLVD